MKKATYILLLILLTISFSRLSAQNGSCGARKGVIKMVREHSINMRSFSKESRSERAEAHSFHFFPKRSVQTKLSVDLLDGKGIHLFTISNVDFLPTINVGARIKAGIKITI